MLYFQPRAILEVVDKLVEMSADTKLARPKELNAQFSLPYLNIKKPIEGKLPAAFGELKQAMTPIAVLTSLELTFENWSLKFDFRVKEPWWSAEAHARSGSGQPLEAKHVDPWMHAIANALAAHPDRPLASLAPEQARETVEVQLAAARRMEAATANMTEQLGRVAIERDQAFTRRQAELDASIAAQREQLSRERIQFDQEKAERDSRLATVVRRQLLADTLKALDKETSVVLSEKTNQKRLAIAVALGIAMLLGVGLIVTTIVVELDGATKSAEALVLLRSLAVSGVLLFASTLWYFVRWQDRWQQTHAIAELQNRKNRKDMLRASWLAELFIETGKDEKIQLPDTLLEEMSHGLFVAPNEATVTEHPLEVLFKRAGLDRLKVGKTGIELNKAPK